MKKMLRLRIKEIAEAKGFNQSSLAREARIGFSTVKRLYRDEHHDASLGVLEKIARALNVSIHDLIEEFPDESAGNSS